MRLSLPSGWTLDLPESFQRIENDDSLQADDGRRTIYLSEFLVRDPQTGKPVPGKRLHETKQRHPGQVFELADDECLGRAHVHSESKDGRTFFHLRATREADGTVLTCVITYVDPADLDWALEIWRSIHGPANEPR